MARNVCYLVALIALSAGYSVAEDCDCQEVVGTCRGAVDVISTAGSAPSFSAEVLVRSSQSSCSKVEYYVDSTPYQTVLISGNRDTESLSGTKPISRQNITQVACYVCASGDAKEAAKKPTAPESGNWHGSYTQPDYTISFTANLTFKDGRITGSIHESHPLAGGSISASVTGTYTDDSVSFTKTYDGTAGINHGVSYSGSYTPGSNAISGQWSVQGMSGSFQMSL